MARRRPLATLALSAIALWLAGCGGLGNPQEECDPITLRTPGGVTDASLLAVDASSTSDVWAVGSSEPFKRSSAGLVLRWDGERWAQTEIERAEHVYDVAALAPDDVWALGSPSDLDEDDWLGHWDGTRWSEGEPPPDWGSVSPSAIDALATDDVWLVGTDFGASGNDETPYIAHWDGAEWSRSEVGVGRGLLEDVSAFSADSVWAVGYAALDEEYGEEVGTLVVRWNGDEWVRVATPKEIDGLDNVEATAADEAWVVPDYFVGEYSPLWRWDGSTWMSESSPMTEISVMSALDGALWAAGSRSTGVAVARFDDSEWEDASIEGVESLDESDPFPGLVAVSKTTAWGVGREPVASRTCIARLRH